MKFIKMFKIFRINNRKPSPLKRDILDVVKNYFDVKYYLDNNVDVKKSRIEPLSHYLMYGWKENRSPSSYFDVRYYLENNPDVKESGVEPLSHYLMYGWKENRSPSSYFDVKYYLENNPDIKESGMEPLSHYLMYGWRENRNPSSHFDVRHYLDNNLEVKELGIEPLCYYIESELHEETSNLRMKSVNHYFLVNVPDIKINSVIDIVIPIYNGYEFLEALFSSICSATYSKHRMIIVNDCSSDSRVGEFLANIDRYKNSKCLEIIVIKNQQNIGFVGSVNLAFERVCNNFVILNSDVEVPNGWLERLMLPFEIDSHIASTTPFTNSGTICSFPKWLQDNQIPFSLSVNEIDAFFAKVNLANTMQVIPTGVGFCMGMNYKLAKSIGLFDQEVFGRGYGEENDWCMKATAVGYKNIHVTNLFVYHKHGGSFGDEKQELAQTNLRKLISKHPNYENKVGSYISKNNLNKLRKMLFLQIVLSRPNATLVFDHTWGGGAEKYFREQILPKHDIVVRVSEDINEKLILVQVFQSEVLTLSLFVESLQSYIDNFLDKIIFEVVYINHLITFGEFELCKNILKNHSRKVTYLVHDYFAVCSKYELINDKGKYCGAELNLDICKTCIMKNEIHQVIKSNIGFYKDIGKWRKNFSEILNLSDKILCFSISSKDIITKIFPDTVDKIEVKPHKLKYIPPYKVGKINFGGATTITVGVMGAIGYHKGSKVLAQIAKMPLFLSGKLKLVLIGYADKKNIKNCKIIGKYEKNNMVNLIKENKVDLFILPSICPETYCYVADEIMYMGFPLISFDLGAQAERIKNYEHGYIASEVNASSLYDKILEVTKKYGAILEKTT